MYHGEHLEFEFEYRDPWEYILNLIHDLSLAPVSSWNSIQKFYCYRVDSGEHVEERIIDEPNTADTWWEIDVSADIHPITALIAFFSRHSPTMARILTATFPFTSGLTRA
jgi:hypothetical protein